MVNLRKWVGGLVTKARDWLNRPIGTGVGVRTAADSGMGIINPSPGLPTLMALQSAAVWACIRLISTATASLPSQIFQQTVDGKVKALLNPYYKMLTASPNPLMTHFDWIQTTVMQLMLYGNSYTWKDRIGGEVISTEFGDQRYGGEVIGLWPLRAERMRVFLHPDGTYGYMYFDVNGRGRVIPNEDMIHFRMISLDGQIGLSPLDYHRLTFDFETFAGQYAIGIYKNGGRPSGVLEYPGTLTQPQVQKIRESWNQIHGGPEGIGRIAILDGGTKYSATSVPLQQLEYIAQQKFSVEQIARIYGVPPHLIGAMDKPTYASVEQQSLEFQQYTIGPVVSALESAIESALLEPPFIYRLNITGFARGDLRARYAAYATARQWGWMSVNDIRELEDMNRIGPQGDIFLQPLNMANAANIPTNVAEDQIATDALGVQP